MASFALNPYSNQELDKLEKDFAALINQSDRILRNPLADDYLIHLGHLLAFQAKIKPPNFFIVKSNEINAFAGPGRYIGVNSALILAADNESELAAVLAHEIAHVRMHHLYNLIEHEKNMQIPMIAAALASAALGALNPTLGTSAIMASLSGFNQNTINFTRANEKEADRIGISTLMGAGFNPHGMVSFFKKMQMQSRYYYMNNIPPILRSHPLDEERMAEALNRIPSRYNTSPTSSLNFILFKELIRTEVSKDTRQLTDYYHNGCMHKGDNIGCLYGMVRTDISAHRYTLALDKLTPLLKTNPDNLYLELAYVDAEMGLNHPELAEKKLDTLLTLYPNHYALMMAYGDTLLAAGKAQKAAQLLLSASRLYRTDLNLCLSLSRAQAAAKQISYAYFTEAECRLLQGEKHQAIAQLKQAFLHAKGDSLLKARIQAKLTDIKELM